MATFTERFTKSGTSTWRAVIRRSGRKPLSATFATKQEAVEWAAAVDAKIDSGVGVAESVTLGEMLASYISELRTLPSADRVTAQEITEYDIAKLKVSTITREVVSEWLETVDGDETADTYRRVLGDAIDYARKYWTFDLPENPAHILAVSNNDHRDRRITAAEERAIIAAADDTRGGYLEDTIILALETALSQSELVALDWSNINLDKRCIFLAKPFEHAVPLSHRAIGVLHTRGIKESGQVFGDLKTGALIRSFIRAVKRAKIIDLHFNDLRYEATCRLFESGNSLEQVRSITGRKSYAPLERIWLQIKQGR